MTYANPFLTDFLPILLNVLEAKKIPAKGMELIIIDEEADGHHIFERADVGDVLEQVCEELNALTIYTDRPLYFSGFVDRAYEENGLLANLFSKKDLKRQEVMATASTNALILDFEWEGTCYTLWQSQKYSYIPIHKKAWKIAENLDIVVPFGYNTVIVKGILTKEKKFVRDRFEEGFYRDE